MHISKQDLEYILLTYIMENLHVDYEIRIVAYDVTIRCNIINPLSPNSDQQQFSPNDIHTLS